MGDSPVLTLADPQATAAFGARLAGLLRPGDVLALHGDLGAGKTALARGLLEALGVDEDVPSPTFTLVQTYEVDPATVWHFDLYRLKRPDEAWELGLEEALAHGISLIEWPDRLGPLLPEERLDIELAHAGEGRTVRLVGHGGWAARLEDLT
ncbi:tRNA (adenosine(37)-N6)-threonylcarbamoyltransferase complex ATPase subunit type 1 TsaE [Zavarzinia sp. CC-PAN008]|uniref:tRNA (adenosine(37)-N6)-threonylcarbamoyltransferase complex ATPase subunit type 1 TsaE n=1 Tax=Zavarzinia sp. CC-PAN008 TaxID=3243332 RepID=UPI003F742EDF